MQTPIRQERPSAIAIVANRVLDAVVVFVGIVIVALPFFAMVREIGLAFVFLAFIGALLIVGRMFVDFLEREYSLYSLESDRLTVERGIISRQRIVIPLDASRIQRVVAQQPFLGRLVGYGHVLIFTAGWGVVRLRYVTDPYIWQSDILEHLAQATPMSSTVSISSRQLPGTQVVNTKLRQSLVLFSSFFLAVCLCGLLFSFGSVTFVKPAPTPTPAPGVIIFPSITGSDMLGALWSIYQIPLIFWSVNAVILGNIVIFLMGVIGKRQR